MACSGGLKTSIGVLGGEERKEACRVSMHVNCEVQKLTLENNRVFTFYMMTILRLFMLDKQEREHNGFLFAFVSTRETT